MNGAPEVQQPMTQTELKELTQQHLKRLPFQEAGMAFNTRHTSRMTDELREADDERTAMMGPGRYDAQFEQRGGGAVPISK